MEENKNKDWKEMFESPIKKHSTSKIEETIAQCLSSLVGEELETTIKTIDYNPNKNGVDIVGSVEIHMKICSSSRPSRKSSNSVIF